MSKGRLSKLQKKIDALKGAATSTVQVPMSYRVWVNGRRLLALGHNTTPEFFIVNDAQGKLIFFPLRRLRRVVIGAEYQELMRQRALSTVPKPPGKGGLTMVRKPDLVVPGPGPAPEGEGA